jgi:hypothetical protein
MQIGTGAAGTMTPTTTAEAFAGAMPCTLVCKMLLPLEQAEYHLDFLSCISWTQSFFIVLPLSH